MEWRSSRNNLRERLLSNGSGSGKLSADDRCRCCGAGHGGKPRRRGIGFARVHHQGGQRRAGGNGSERTRRNGRGSSDTNDAERTWRVGKFQQPNPGKFAGHDHGGHLHVKSGGRHDHRYRRWRGGSSDYRC